MENTRYKIYKLIDPITKDVRYVGQTKRSLEQRLNEHVKGYGQKTNTFKRNWINKLLKQGLTPIIELQESGLTKSTVSEREIYWIKFYKEHDFKLTNATSGGEGPLDYKHSEETRAKLKKSLTGRYLSESHRKNIGKASTGRLLSEDSRAKLADRVKQEWQNNQERLQEMKARTGESNPNWGGKFPGVVIHDKEGNLIGEFDHLQYAADSTGLTKSYIRACALGKKKPVKYVIEIKEDVRA